MDLPDALQNKSSLKYNNLWDIWQQAREQETPKGFKTPEQRQGTSKPYMMKPEDMATLLNAFTPMDLYNKPQGKFIEEGIDYPTSAFNIRNPSGVGVPNSITMASQKPESNFLPIYPISDLAKTYTDIPMSRRANIPQAVASHEFKHEFDPRLNQMINRGYLVKNGMYQGTPISVRENPAIRAEDKFWYALLKDRGKK